MMARLTDYLINKENLIRQIMSKIKNDISTKDCTKEACEDLRYEYRSYEGQLTALNDFQSFVHTRYFGLSCPHCFNETRFENLFVEKEELKL